jgi:type IV pilus assembly protein PilE
MKTGGFTLIEVMIVVAIIAILTAIAVPGYMQHVQRGRIVEATSQLATYRVKLEQYYQDNKNYGSTASVCGNSIGTATGDYFNFTCNWGAGATNQSFLITATGKASMAGFSFTVDQSNGRATTGFPGQSGVPAACWITRKGDAC